MVLYNSFSSILSQFLSQLRIFHPDLNMHLFSNIILASDQLVWVNRFQLSNKWMMKKYIDYLKDKNFQAMTGIINDVDQKYFNKRYFL